MVTIMDVAKEAGVSVATVSRVLNNSEKVRPKTVAQVRGAIERLQYVPNMSARNLRRNESRVVIALARNFTNPFYAHVLSGITDVAREAGYTVMSCKNSGDPEQSLTYCQMLENHQVDGIILLNYTEVDEWIDPYAGKYPIVQCCEFHPGLNVPRVVVDHFDTGYKSTSYLLSLGHKRIGYMGANNTHSSAKYRYEGYCAALKEHGIDQEARYIVKADGDYTFESGKRAAVTLLSQKEKPTAVFCNSDILALATILTATEMGLQVPGDLSVMGCDDVDYTTMMHPFLTTVRLPCYDLGRTAMKQLLKSIRELPKMGTEICLDFSLQIRESTAPAIQKQK